MIIMEKQMSNLELLPCVAYLARPPPVGGAAEFQARYVAHPGWLCRCPNQIILTPPAMHQVCTTFHNVTDILKKVLKIHSWI